MKHIELHNIEFKEKVDAFERRLVQQGKSKSTIECCTSHSKEFLDYMTRLGVQELSKITQTKIDKYLDYLTTRPNLRRGGGLSIAYQNKQRYAVLRFMEFIEGVGIGKSNFDIRELKVPLTEIEVLSREEIQQLFDSCDNTLSGLTDKCMLALLYGCGMRKGEVHTLEVHEIDFGKGFIRLDRTKTKQERDVVMSPSVQKIVEEYVYSVRPIMLAQDSNETYMIVSENGKQVSLGTIPWRVKKMAERSGIGRNIHPHIFRHSIGTHLIDDLTIEEVADFLGHKNLDSTARYTHMNELLKNRKNDTDKAI